MPQVTRDAANLEFRRHAEPGDEITLAVARDRRIDGQADRVVTTLLAALDKVPGNPAILENIDLVHLRPVGNRRDVLDRRRAQRRQAVDRAEVLRRPRDRRLFLVVKQPRRAGRREKHRPVDFFAEQCRFEVNLADVRKLRWQQLIVIEGGRISPQGDLVIGAAVHVIEDGPR